MIFFKLGKHLVRRMLFFYIENVLLRSNLIEESLILNYFFICCNVLFWLKCLKKIHPHCYAVRKGKKFLFLDDY